MIHINPVVAKFTATVTAGKIYQVDYYNKKILWTLSATELKCDIIKMDMSVLINFKICDNSKDCNGIKVCPVGVFFWDEKRRVL